MDEIPIPVTGITEEKTGRYWAKRDSRGTHLLEYHLIDTAAVCKAYLTRDTRILKSFKIPEPYGSDAVIDLIVFFSSVHDIGKICPAFQKADGFSNGYRHDVGGYNLMIGSCFDTIARSVGFTSGNRRDRRSLRSLIRASAMHHGSPRGCDDQLHYDRFVTMFDEQSRESARVVIEEMAKLFKVAPGICDAIIHSDDFNRLTNIVAAVINQCDWIASGEFDYHSEAISLSDYFSIARDRADAIIGEDSLNIFRKEVEQLDFELIFGFPPSPAQSEMSSLDATSPFLCIVEDATGSGKTEAALFCALRCLESTDADGITFALPTRSTSNLIFTRLNGYASSMVSDDVSVSLQHGSSRYFLENAGLDIDRGWTFGKNKALFANISVCTVDQILCSVIPVRYQPLKLLAAARHVVVVDEVHAYDAYTFGLLCEFIHYCKLYGVPIVLLSATIPSKMKRQLIESYGCCTSTLSWEYPLITVCRDVVEQEPVECSQRSLRNVPIRYISDNTAVIDELVSLANDGMRACWIRNTVDDAIEAFDSIPDGPYQKVLLHSRFIAADRTAIEGELFRQCGKGAIPEGMIVIGTQVIEQSLDIEFERVYSDLAPIDSLIQRLGRDQRFNDSPIGCEFVVNGPPMTSVPDEFWYSRYLPRAAFVYRNHSVLFNTAVLMQEGKISIPADYRRMIEFAYGEPGPDSPFFANYEEFMGIIKGSIANYKRVVLDPETCYGCSLASEFSDSQWEAVQRATTRETDERTVQCLLLQEFDGKTIPLSGNPETSTVAVKKKNAVGITETAYEHGKWQYVVKLLMTKATDDDGNECWNNKNGLRYSRTRGLEYV